MDINEDERAKGKTVECKKKNYKKKIKNKK
jgi:hypothetical protein